MDCGVDMDGVPDLDALELLAAVVRHGSISAAARERGIAQQSASARIRAVERELGLDLLVRSARGAMPTADGRVVATWAEEVLAAAGRLRVGVETLRGAHRRELTVAASETVSAHMLPRWLVTLRERQLAAGHPVTAVHLTTANSAEVESLLLGGAVELAFIEQRRVTPGLSQSMVAEDELAVVVAPGHRWGATVGLDEVAATALVVREEGSGTRQTWEDAVRTRLGHDPAPPAAVLPTTPAVRSAVAEGLGPALLSRRAVADDIRLGRLREVALEGAPVTRPITALWRGTPRDLSVTSRELIEIAARG